MPVWWGSCQAVRGCAGTSDLVKLEEVDMARVALGLVMAGLLLAAAPAAAVICTIDAVPAATLLLPYFEVDLNNPNGLTTLFSVNNASATAILVHVVIWSDLSVPVLDFNIYLTGYHPHSVNMPHNHLTATSPIPPSPAH